MQQYAIPFHLRMSILYRGWTDQVTFCLKNLPPTCPRSSLLSPLLSWLLHSMPIKNDCIPSSHDYTRLWKHRFSHTPPYPTCFMGCCSYWFAYPELVLAVNPIAFMPAQSSLELPERPRKKRHAQRRDGCSAVFRAWPGWWLGDANRGYHGRSVDPAMYNPLYWNFGWTNNSYL